MVKSNRYQAHNLSVLNDVDYWLLFAKIALLSNDYLGLEEVGREIVKKCNGLPLAVQTLGSLLSTKDNERDWYDILNNEIWEFSEEESEILPALRISYYHLPSYLKRCFVYCSLYPKDYEFDKDEMMLLWMAEGLLQRPKSGSTLEEVGYEYFDDLVSRSFFQPSNNAFVMHDLATFYDEKFYLEPLKSTMYSSMIPDFIICHLSETPIMTLPESLGILYNLQMLKLRYREKLKKLPTNFQNLVNLHHHDTEGTKLEEMPKGMSKLQDLQVLSNYVVGKNEETRVGELGELAHLHGSLRIEKLENVNNSCAASNARMDEKIHLNALYFIWSSFEGEICDSQIEKDVLDKLHPHKN
ncbi:hypothetical protein PIB30_062569 [Stylosanthes scabra]|uniref:NB-ARC domain-containing protein n=1 Tax=Stylosanthes scabra TaxID=79078 RepID=A0ABU6ZJY5_9FABA|nr:hypothetical protein [Stylosanthes scabra]